MKKINENMEKWPKERIITNATAVDTSSIPDYVKEDLAATVFRAVQDYFQQPGTQEKYEAWQAERKKKGETSCESSSKNPASADTSPK